MTNQGDSPLQHIRTQEAAKGRVLNIDKTVGEGEEKFCRQIYSPETTPFGVWMNIHSQTRNKVSDHELFDQHVTHAFPISCSCGTYPLTETFTTPGDRGDASYNCPVRNKLSNKVLFHNQNTHVNDTRKQNHRTDTMQRDPIPTVWGARLFELGRIYVTPQGTAAPANHATASEFQVPLVTCRTQTTGRTDLNPLKADSNRHKAK